MSKALEKQKEKELATVAGPQMVEEEILASDILIPRLLLMQPLSNFVDEGIARPGEMVKSTTKEVVAKAKEALDIVPLKMENEWTYMEEVGGKYQFRHREPRTGATENLPMEFTDKGTRWKRVKTLNVYALLLSDVIGFDEKIAKGEMPDLSQVFTPVLISFRSTSFTAGRGVVNFYASIKQMHMMGAKQVAPYQYCLPLSCAPKENAKGKFHVLEIGKPVEIAKKMGDAEKAARVLEHTARWYSIVNSSKLKVDDSDEGPETTGGSSGEF